MQLPSITTTGLICNAIGSTVWGVWVTRSLRKLLPKKKKEVAPMNNIPLPTFEDEGPETLRQIPVSRPIAWREALEQQALLAGSCFADIYPDIKDDAELRKLVSAAYSACANLSAYMHQRRG